MKRSFVIYVELWSVSVNTFTGTTVGRMLLHVLEAVYFSSNGVFTKYVVSVPLPLTYVGPLHSHSYPAPIKSLAVFSVTCATKTEEVMSQKMDREMRMHKMWWDTPESAPHILLIRYYYNTQSKGKAWHRLKQNAKRVNTVSPNRHTNISTDFHKAIRGRQTSDKENFETSWEITQTKDAKLLILCAQAIEMFMLCPHKGI